MITHLKTVGVPVADQARAAGFYTEKLGFEVRKNQPMGPGARWIELALPGCATRIVPFTPPGLESRIGSFTGVVLACDDIAATHRQLADRGVEFTQAPRAQPGGTMAMFKDSEGNIFVLAEDKE